MDGNAELPDGRRVRWSTKQNNRLINIEYKGGYNREFKARNAKRRTNVKKSLKYSSLKNVPMSEKVKESFWLERCQHDNENECQKQAENRILQQERNTLRKRIVRRKFGLAN